MSMQDRFCSLDLLAASTSQEMVSVIEVKVKDGIVTSDSLENLATKALGVLQEQGIYALVLFLLSRSGSSTDIKGLKKEEYVACKIVYELLNLLKTRELEALNIKFTKNIQSPQMVNNKGEKTAILKYFTSPGSLLEDIDKLLLIRDVYEQTLIYTRFVAKACKEEK